ncbi:endonuclease [Paenibacillus faecis]|uniref:NUMOD4 domain-containing protein n=1 Tax=Paenibacillus faecis TaxID=862114 RepID=UPI001B06AFA0|nr:NUMOD4 domain-containing protein [Paenibacillus faecis]GIO85081.1 endonuclease [Paenibacillus faecis]
MTINKLNQNEDIQDEEWLPVVSYEGLYEVSNLGRVKRLSSSDTSKEKILKPQIQRDGYQRVTLSKKDQKKRMTIHRLVAIAFIPNPENKEQVNHENGNKLDNRLKNLNWATPKENIAHAIAHGLIKKNSKPIAATHLDTGERCEFESQSEASRILFVSMNKIYDVLNGRLAHACGWIFKHLDDSRIEQQIALSEREQQHPYTKNRSVLS